jgi:acyl-CoA dehydrogenase
MEFQESPEHTAIREAVRDICKGFDAEYWRQHEKNHEFPWKFHNEMAAAGWIGTAIPEEFGGGDGGVTEASIVMEEVAASGGAMNAASALHILRLRHEPGRPVRLPGAEGEVPGPGRHR